MGSFSRKKLEVKLVLGAGTFGGEGNTKVITLLATQAKVEKVGLPDKNKASVRIANMKIDDMGQLTTLAFRPLETQKNLVSIMAGDEESGLSQVFAGEITTAYADFNIAPDPVFLVEAMAGYYPALVSSSPTAVKGSIAVSDFISQQANKISYTFKNLGVTDQLRNAIFSGSPLEQAIAAAEQVGKQLIIDDSTLTLMNPDKTRGDTVVLNKESGLIGYPSFNSDGISVKCIFNAALELGGKIKIESIVPKASGVWKITKLTHTLTANSSGGGPWQSDIEGTYLEEI